MQRILTAAVCILLVSGCTGQRPAAPRVYQRDAVPRAEPLSQYGNPDSYVQDGRRYFVLATARGYRERGVASWYGKQFHGRRTSSGESYDMYAMTAAHRTLPLPSYVRVTNLNNGRSVIVRVNDRGPFVRERIIDLSYSAAEKLDMIREGTALVEVESVEPGATANAGAPAPPVRVVESRYSNVADWRDQSHLQNRIFIQTGAFALRDNAEKMLSRLQAANVGNVQIIATGDNAVPIHRVRIGPLGSVAAMDATVVQLQGLGFADYQIVIE